MKLDKQSVLQVLSRVLHPEKKADIVSSGMVGEILFGTDTLTVHLMLQRPNDPFTNAIKRNSENMLRDHYGKGITVEIVVHQPDKQEKQGYKALEKIRKIISVSSGKGRVGKSTIAVNLAVAVARTGAKVGILDADLYGPSAPKMFGAEEFKPEVSEEDHLQLFHPLEKYGVKVLSIGFFVDPTNPLMWRGPMATSALKQLIHQTKWDELDYLFIDMPPGTGDIHISLVQEMAITGAVIVSTPQQVALADVVKGIGMFTAEKVNVPVLGIIENMSWFTPEELPGNKYYIFGKEGCKKLAEQFKIPLLGQIPVVQSISESGDSGKPAALDPSTIQGKAFSDLATALITEISKRNSSLPPTQKVEMK